MKWNPYFVEKEINRLTKAIKSLYDSYSFTSLLHMEDEKKMQKERKFIDREIEILENLLRIEEKKLEAITAYYLYQESDEQKTQIKKKGETSPTLTHKQQMVLLNQLGFLNAAVFEKLDDNTEKKAEILGNLLNRNIQETRELLTYFNDPKGTHKKFSNTLENKEAVCHLLEQSSLTFADKKE